MRDAADQGQDPLAEPEGDDGGDGDGAEEAVGASVVSGSDAMPILQASEHDLDTMSLAAEVGVVGDWHLAAAR